MATLRKQDDVHDHTSPESENENQGELLPSDSRSLFDSIKEINEQGHEEWSARRLQPLLGYGAWHRFLKVIETAMIAAKLSGHDVEANFSLSGEVSGTRGPSRLDYRLSRLACYLIAMRGDSHKKPIAHALTYFAFQTRKQEIAEQAADHSPTDLVNLSDVRAIKQVYQAFGAALAKIDEQAALIEREQTARMIEAAGRQAAEEENEILLPKAAQADHHRAADGLMTFGDFANKLNAFAQQNYGVRVYHKEVWDFAGEMGLIIRGNTVRKNRPTSFATLKDYVRESESEHVDSKGKLHTNHTSRLTPRGDGWLWDRAVRRIEHFNTLKPVKAGAA